MTDHTYCRLRKNTIYPLIRLWLLIIGLYLFNNPASAETISGRVEDSNNGEPLGGVFIWPFPSVSE
jgi:hypothetical protein